MTHFSEDILILINDKKLFLIDFFEEKIQKFKIFKDSITSILTHKNKIMIGFLKGKISILSVDLS